MKWAYMATFGCFDRVSAHWLRSLHNAHCCNTSSRNGTWDWSDQKAIIMLRDAQTTPCAGITLQVTSTDALSLNVLCSSISCGHVTAWAGSTWHYQAGWAWHWSCTHRVIMDWLQLHGQATLTMLSKMRLRKLHIVEHMLTLPCIAHDLCY